MNTYPPTMMVPEYIKTGKDEGTVKKKTILTDYVRQLCSDKTKSSLGTGIYARSWANCA